MTGGCSSATPLFLGLPCQGFPTSSPALPTNLQQKGHCHLSAQWL
jgi:hypothetical protein